jgi:hypothetical protein
MHITIFEIEFLAIFLKPNFKSILVEIFVS